MFRVTGYNGGRAGTQSLSYQRYDVMSKALNATGSPILYSLCNWGEDSPWNWAQTMSNSWRMSGDIYDSFSRPDVRCPCTGDEEGYLCNLPGFHCSVLNIMNKMARIVSKTQSGAQNDMDMLEVGNGGMTDDEYKVHFSIWALNASPMITAPPAENMSSSTRGNATDMSFGEGLEMHAPAVMGVRVGNISAHGNWTTVVPRHGIGLFRLKPIAKPKTKRDEL